MKAWPALISGVLFGLGLTLSGMSDPAKVLGFLNITGAWIPDLIFVMGGAVVVTARQAAFGPTFGWRRRVIWHRLGIIGLLPGTCLGEPSLRLQIYRGVLLGHVRRDGARGSNQPLVRLTMSAGDLLDLGVAMTGLAQTV